MGEALLAGMISGDRLSADEIIVAEPVEARREELTARYSVTVTPDAAMAVSSANTHIMAVKPQVMGEVLDQLRPAMGKGDLVISIAAGIATRFIESRLHPENRVVRSMPNTPALVGAGVTAICAGSVATDSDLDLTESMLSSVGKVIRVDEKMMDQVTAISGSGPAYFFLFTEELVKTGTALGLSAEAAGDLAIQTMIGAGKLLAETGKSPTELREMVTSPGGTTAAAIKAFHDNGLSAVVNAAAKAASKRGLYWIVTRIVLPILFSLYLYTLIIPLLNITSSTDPVEEPRVPLPSITLSDDPSADSGGDIPDILDSLGKGSILITRPDSIELRDPRGEKIAEGPIPEHLLDGRLLGWARGQPTAIYVAKMGTQETVRAIDFANREDRVVYVPEDGEIVARVLASSHTDIEGDPFTRFLVEVKDATAVSRVYESTWPGTEFREIFPRVWDQNRPLSDFYQLTLRDYGPGEDEVIAALSSSGEDSTNETVVTIDASDPSLTVTQEAELLETSPEEVLIVVDVDTMEATRISSKDTPLVGTAILSPNGQNVAFDVIDLSDSGSFNTDVYLAEFGADDPLSMSTIGGPPTRLTTAGESEQSVASFISNGSRIILSRSGPLVGSTASVVSLLDLETKQARELITYTGERVLPLGMAANETVFIVQVGGSIDGSGQIEGIDLATGTSSVVTRRMTSAILWK